MFFIENLGFSLKLQGFALTNITKPIEKQVFG
jgi:hypothetical protein